ncbi:MAG: sigma-70 family RNA polymerase sigma factor [Fimbriimonadia bacterium]|nr:sigma-70 family RNA polymerase sigma factor [Fimbriimonadia bacterium]
MMLTNETDAESERVMDSRQQLLWTLAQPSVERIAKQTIGSLPTFEEDIQDVYMRARVALLSFENPIPSEGWIPQLMAFVKRVSHDACVDVLRSAHTRHSVPFSRMPPGWETDLTAEDLSEQIIDHLDRGLCLERAVMALSMLPSRQAVAWLLHLDSDIANEIYERLNPQAKQKLVSATQLAIEPLLSHAPLTDSELAEKLQTSLASARQLRWRAKATLQQWVQT